MRTRLASLLARSVLCLCVATTVARAERPATQSTDALALIRDEGLNRSKVAETAEALCNGVGPRLTGSPAVRRANLWARDTLSGWGLSDARLEPWGPFGRGWTLSRFSLAVTQPYPFVVNAYPKAWSPGLERAVESDIVYLDAKAEADLQPYADRVRGRIVLIGSPRPPGDPFEPLARRLDDDRLAALAADDRSTIDLMRPAATQPTTHPGPATRPAGPGADFAAKAFAAKALAFAAAHGAAAVLTSSPGGDAGTIFVTGATVPDDTPRTGPGGPMTRPQAWWPDSGIAAPQIVVGVEDFARLVTLSRRDVPLRTVLDLKADFTEEMPQQHNTLADLPGTDKADEIVMCGAHLDSWHSATGATDNASGVVVAMEAVRLIHASGLKPRRTIRVALWTGEEQGVLGSAAYVKAHFGRMNEPATQPATRPSPPPDAHDLLAVNDIPTTRAATQPARLTKGSAYEKLSVYFNLDHGTGRIRGIYSENNRAAVPIFQQWFRPLADLGATTVAPGGTGFTDHICFDTLGLPGFQFIQDPIDYFTRTHHANADTFERLQIDDLKQAAVVMATFLWNAANAEERFPRKPLVLAPGMPGEG
ncbi:MAG TPA: M20/M25/M40 family metallo-hydrolase [Tepidisphaeraceae bacterium]